MRASHGTNNTAPQDSRPAILALMQSAALILAAVLAIPAAAVAAWRFWAAVPASDGAGPRALDVTWTLVPLVLLVVLIVASA